MQFKSESARQVVEPHQNRFDVDIQVSPYFVIGLLGFTSFILFMFSFYTTDLGMRFWIFVTFLLVVFLSVVALRLAHTHITASRWFTLMLATGFVHTCMSWIGLADSQVLVLIPVMIAAVMIGFSSLLVTAVIETIFLLLAAAWVEPILVIHQVPLILVIWVLVVLLAAVYRPILQVVDWTGKYYFQVREEQESTRNREGQLKQAMKDLEQANQQLTRMNRLAHDLRQVAEDARAAKAEFVANVSHELRTPLNMITGFTEMILQSPETYGKRIPRSLLADLSVIHRNAEHLKALIDDVLDMSQIEADQMALTREYVPFEEIIDFAITAVRPLYELRKLYLRVHFKDELPPVFCDRTRIREVLLNLLSNAGRFTEQGGVDITAWREGDFMMVLVKDTGPGISDHDLEKLFKPFQQVDGSIRRRYGGTGLGLAISKQFIELHEGKIWVDSRIGEGTAFTFRIPISAPTVSAGDFSRWFNPYTAYDNRDRLPDLPKNPPRPRFVIMETGSVLRRLLNRYIKNIEIVVVETLDQACTELMSEPAQALLVNTLSINETQDAIERTACLPAGVPVIVCSVPGIQEVSASMNVAGILVKPIARDQLLEALDTSGIDQGTILIVDDEPDALQLFGRMLSSSQNKYHILQARDGIEATSILQEYRPDAILLDLVMPNMDGFEVLEWRDQHPEIQDVPIFIISARDPVEQPIVSKKLAVAQVGGFSVRQLLASIEAMSLILSPTGGGTPLPVQNQRPGPIFKIGEPPGGQVPPAAPSD
jgi:signal transduction histidine kinase/CheY-like chemotaxis protein